MSHPFLSKISSITTLEELNGYVEQARLRELSPGEAQAIAERRRELSK